jgi:hypothetical protein
MKKLLLLIALSVLCSAPSLLNAQNVTPGVTPSLPPPQFSTSQGYFCPMWNCNSYLEGYGAYYNQYNSLQAASAAIDTSCSGCTFNPLYLTVSRFKFSTSVANDTVYPSQTQGTGSVNFCIQAYKATTTGTVIPTCVVTLMSSNNGYAWEQVPSTSIYTMSPTSVLTASTTPMNVCWDNVTKNALEYELKVSVTGDTASFRAQMYFQPTQSYHYTSN